MKSEDHDPRWLCDREKTRSRSGLALVLWIVGWARAVTAAVGGVAPLSSVEVPKQLTLFEARRLAFAHNWDLLAAKSDIDVATAQTIIAREFPNLAVAYSSAKRPADNHSSSTEGGNGLWQRNYDTIIAINQLFEIGGKRSSRRASADAGFEGARARLLEAKRQLDLAVTRAYIAALQAASDVKILRQSSESLRSEARIAESRLAAGDISKSDKNQIAIAAERFELDARSADTTAATLRLPETDRRLANLKNVLVDTPEGMHIPLDQVVTFKLGSGAMNISRENGKRVLAIGVFIRGRDMGSVVADMQQQVKSVALPEGYYVTWSGEFENQQRAMKRLAFIVPVSVFLIFVLLFDAFKSARSSLLILLNVPFALIGGILALLSSGIPLSVSAAIGFIALFGQAVLNGVVMVSHFNQLRDNGSTPFEAVLNGALIRLRIVLMTTLLAMLGLLPMALSHGIGSETQRPLAVVIIGGLISATLLTLFLLPTLYLLFEGHQAEAD